MYNLGLCERLFIFSFYIDAIYVVFLDLPIVNIQKSSAVFQTLKSNSSLPVNYITSQALS
jgi:hypothetical protein